MNVPPTGTGSGQNGLNAFLSFMHRSKEACNALDIYFFNHLYLLSETIVNELSIAM